MEPTVTAHSPLTTMPDPRARSPHALRLLLLAGLLTVVLWHLPFGRLVLYPFTLLATWFHEMGHGLTALLLGGQFHQLIINPDASGMAPNSVPPGRMNQALMALGGPLGPAVAGAFMILIARHQRLTRGVLAALGLALIGSAVMWVRTPFALGLLMALGVVVLLFVWDAGPAASAFGVQFLGVQACLSTWGQLDYLFKNQATVGGRTLTSDTGLIAQATGLPHLLWAVLLSGATLGLLALSLWLAYRPGRPRSPRLRLV